MKNLKNPVFIIGAIAFLIVAGLTWNYTEAMKAKNETELVQNQKEFVAKRKNDCLKIYEVEGEKWGNVKSWRYDEVADECLILYKHTEENEEGDFEVSF